MFFLLLRRMVWLTLRLQMGNLLETWAFGTQASREWGEGKAEDGRDRDLLVHEMMLTPLSHTSSCFQWMGPGAERIRWES